MSARSRGIDDYESGDLPFVTSTEANNGVVAYVTPEPEDRVFEGPALVISGLGFATVQLRKFLPKGNGGDSLTVFKPKNEMKVGELLGIAAAFNVLHQWRFGFGRKASIGRLKSLEIPYPLPSSAAGTWPAEKAQVAALTTALDAMFTGMVARFTDSERATVRSLAKGEDDSDSDDGVR